MDDDAKFIRIFGRHQGRATYAGRLRIRDGNFIAELKARLSGLAARDNRARNSGWLIEFTPTQTDDLTERSAFHATLTSPRLGERTLAFQIGRDWVEIDGAMESAARGERANLEAALESAFRRAVLRWPYGTMDPASVKRVSAA